MFRRNDVPTVINGNKSSFAVQMQNFQINWHESKVKSCNNIIRMAEIYCTLSIMVGFTTLGIRNSLCSTKRCRYSCPLTQPPDADYSLWIPTVRRNPVWYVNCLLPFARGFGKVHPIVLPIERLIGRK